MRFNKAVLVALTVIVSTSLWAQQARTAPVSSPIAADNPVLTKLPLVFEANRGQTNGKVNFLSRGSEYTAFLTAGGMVLSLRPPAVVNRTSGSQPASATLQFRLLGANKHPQAVGEQRQRGIVNYFIGNNPAQWQKHVPTYAQVRYKDVYPGIDLIYYGTHQQLEYDFAVAPGADPRLIQFQIQGADETHIDADGDLILTTNGGDLHFKSPIVYQESGGQRIPIEGGYAMNDATDVGFHVAQYDASKPLVIDPVLVYSTYVGGSGSDQLTGIVTDSTGSVYVSGYTNSANFPSNTLNGLATNANHVFVAKLDSTGSNLVYADYIGGNSQDYGIGLALDGTGNVYVTGSTESNNFPMVKPFQSQLPGPYSGFLTKVSADGSSILYSTYLGGNTFDQPTGIAVDSLAQVHIAGFTMSHNFPVLNAYEATALPNQAGLYGTYGFLTKFSSDGSSLVYSTFLAGNSNVVQDCGSPCWPAPYNSINGVAIDTNGSAYVTGSTNTYNFPTTAGTYQTSDTTQQDTGVGFVSKFNITGGLDYSSYFYSTGGYPVTPNALAVDISGSAYITGVAFSDGSFPVTSTSICDPGTYGFGCSYAFVTKFDPTASTLVYSTFLGPNNYATPLAIAVDLDNDAYVVAAGRSAAFGTVNAIEPYSSGEDVLLVEIDSVAGTQLLATYLGGSGDDSVAGLALGGNGDVYVAGSTSSVDFPTTQGVFQTQSGGALDGFIAKIGAAAASMVSVSPSSMQFGTLPIGSTSHNQSILLRNMGSAALSISSITITGDFAETDNCGTSVAQVSSCNFSVTFTPSGPGVRSGSIVVVDDAAGSPHYISLNGTGAAPNILLSPTTLTFPGTLVGASSTSQAVTLTNNGTATLSINSIQITGDYTEANNCPIALAYGASCTINVQFNPTAPGTRSGTLTVADNASGSPQTMSLSGTGTNLSVVLTPSILTFSATPVSTSSIAQTVLFTNSGTAAVSISNIQITGDYSQTNNCPPTLASSASCAINVRFTPTVTGVRTGTLSISDNVLGTPQTVSLSGTGVDFSIASSPSQNTVKAGSSATYALNISSVGGSFANSVSLTCSGLPANATCKFSPVAVIPGASCTLTISTTSSSAQAIPVLPSSNRPVLAIWAQIQGLGLFGMMLAGSKKRSKRLFIFVLLALLILGMIFMSGCAGGTGIVSPSGSGQGSGTSYTITLTGTSGTVHHSIPISLTVQ